MTNNPTIDGVSRELLERCALHLEWYGDVPATNRAMELRALLDAPVVEPAKDLREHCKQCAEVVKTWPEWKRGCLGGQPVVELQPGDEVSELGALRRLTEDSCNELVSRCLEHADEVASMQSTIAQLQARVQELENGRGEPIYQLEYLADPGWRDASLHEFNVASKLKGYRVRTVYTAPTAPVAVDLLRQARGSVSHLSLRGDDIGNENHALLKNIDACLDATAALNEVKS